MDLTMSLFMWRRSPQRRTGECGGGTTGLTPQVTLWSFAQYSVGVTPSCRALEQPFFGGRQLDSS
jgi:hypothetical protein